MSKRAGYTPEQKAQAIATIERAGGLTQDAIAAVRDQLNAPSLSLSTLHGWIKSARVVSPVSDVEFVVSSESTEIVSKAPENVEPAQNSNLKELNDKERLFCEQYFICKLNGTEAALASYNTTDRATAGAIAYEVLKRPHVRAYVDARLAEYHLSANEVLARIAFDATSSMADFVDTDSGTIDMKKANQAKSLGLLKRYRTKHIINSKDDTETLEAEIELYDGQAARRDLAKHLGLFAADTNINIQLTQLSDEELTALANGKRMITAEVVK